MTAIVKVSLKVTNINKKIELRHDFSKETANQTSKFIITIFAVVSWKGLLTRVSKIWKLHLLEEDYVVITIHT